jgi:hypothetical protein
LGNTAIKNHAKDVKNVTHSVDGYPKTGAAGHRIGEAKIQVMCHDVLAAGDATIKNDANAIKEGIASTPCEAEPVCDDPGLLAAAALLEAGQAVHTVTMQEPQSHSYCCRTKSLAQ